MKGRAFWAGVALSASVVPLAAQTRTVSADQKQSRYQIGVMERVLEGAVEHGATMTRDKLQAVLPPSQMLISENAHVRGFRLDGYGVFFDVEVPSLEGTFWSFRTLDQNDLGLRSALQALKAHVDAAGDVELQQALKRVELQVEPVPMLASSPPPAVAAGARNAIGSAASVPDGAAATVPAVTPPPDDAVLSHPEETFRQDIKQALVEAMLDHSGPLAIGPDEWLTIAARRNEERPRLAPADSDAQTMIIRAKGSDLNAFRAGQIGREEAIKRMDVRVF